MGKSGSGKSTLLNQLGCLDTPSSGEYYLDGVPVRRMSRSACRAPQPQDRFHLPELQSAAQDHKHRKRWNCRCAQCWVSAAGRARRGGTEGRGAQNRLTHRATRCRADAARGPARALVNNPAVILADEPRKPRHTHFFRDTIAAGSTQDHCRNHCPARYFERSMQLRDGGDATTTTTYGAAEGRACLPTSATNNLPTKQQALFNLFKIASGP